MSSLTIAERIILHLSRYDMVDPEDMYNIPWDLTQDGIASSLRISRAHASIELKKLRMGNKISEKQTHIKGGKAKRKSYLLTPQGINEARRIKEFAEEEGLDIMPLLDMRRCDPGSLMESMDEESRRVLWLACLLRCSVRRDSLPDTRQSVIPVDVSGNTAIGDEARKNIVSVIPEEDLRWLHSEAADYWLVADEPDRRERLYHLAKAGRMTDACKLLIRDRDIFMDDLDEDLLDIVDGMEEIPARYLADVLPIKAAVLIESGELEKAADVVDALTEVDRDAGMLYLSDLALLSGDADRALDIISSVGAADTVPVNIRKAKALMEKGDLNEAKDILERTKSEISRTGGADHLSDVYIALSDVSVRLGIPEDGVLCLNKAKSSAGPRDLKRIYRKMAEVYEAMGIAEDIRRGI